MKWMEKWKGGGRGGWAALLVLALALVFCALLLGENDTATRQEQRLEKVLCAIEGAGRVQAAIFYQQAADTGEMFSVTQKEEIPVGCVIVAQGAGDVGVRLRLVSAARTLLNLTEAQVNVFTMAQEEAK